MPHTDDAPSLNRAGQRSTPSFSIRERETLAWHVRLSPAFTSRAHFRPPPAPAARSPEQRPDPRPLFMEPLRRAAKRKLSPESTITLLPSSKTSRLGIRRLARTSGHHIYRWTAAFCWRDKPIVILNTDTLHRRRWVLLLPAHGNLSGGGRATDSDVITERPRQKPEGGRKAVSGERRQACWNILQIHAAQQTTRPGEQTPRCHLERASSSRGRW
jgi:hypothetical protein